MELRYEVHWIDSGLYIDGWKTKEEIVSQSVVEVETVGFLVHEDENCIYMALTRHKGHGSYYGVQVIWKKSITSMERLRER